MAIKGDFISFTYNGVHSTELGVLRVTSSNRYTDALLPIIQDKTVQASGSDGTYFFGSYYTQRQITINVAFDEVSEAQIRLMRKIFGDGLVHDLIFDDEPYKVYSAKATGTPQLQYVPFSNPRIYKGEGTFTFTCFDPFARCPNEYKNISVWQPGTPPWYKYDNKSEWNTTLLLDDVYVSGLINTIGSIYDHYTPGVGERRFLLYNPGDLEADFKLYVPVTANSQPMASQLTGIQLVIQGQRTAILTVSNIEAQGLDTYICFNSKLNLIEGAVSDNNGKFIKTGNIYNKFITAGTWFKIPLYKYLVPQHLQLIFKNGYTDGNLPASDAPILEYDYLYF